MTGSRGTLGRLSTGHWMMLVAGIAAVVLNFAFLRSQQHTISVAVAATDLDAGSRIGLDDVSFTPVHAEAAIEHQLISNADLDAVVGMVVDHSIPAGELLLKSDFLTEANGTRSMSIPVDRDHAVGGLLRRGDLVDVVMSDQGVARFIVVGAEVLSVSDTSGSLASGYSITVALDAESVLRVAAAASSGTVEIVRSTGAPAPGSMVFPEQP